MSVRQRVPALIEADSEEWEVRLRLRDALRLEPAFRQHYQQLKRRLLREHPFDRLAYTGAKSAFVAQVLAEHP